MSGSLQLGYDLEIPRVLSRAGLGKISARLPGGSCTARGTRQEILERIIDPRSDRFQRSCLDKGRMNANRACFARDLADDANHADSARTTRSDIGAIRSSRIRAPREDSER